MWSDRASHQLIEPGDLGFWKSLWVSPLFAQLFDDPATGYGRLLERIAARPWWLINSTHDYERRHFSTWFGHAIVRRQYANPLIQDLYYWHDLLHGMTFRDATGVDFNRWRELMRANEIATSLETEVILYWRAPQLREHTFAHPIWHDRITPAIGVRDRERLLAYRASPTTRDPSGVEARLWSARLPDWPLPHEFCSTRDLPSHMALWQLRRAITRSPDPALPVEVDMAGYEHQAEVFYEAWRPLWREVEAHRARFAAHCRQREFQQAIDLQMREFERTSNADGVPYGDIAKGLGL